MSLFSSIGKLISKALPIAQTAGNVASKVAGVVPGVAKIIPGIGTAVQVFEAGNQLQSAVLSGGRTAVSQIAAGQAAAAAGGPMSLASFPRAPTQIKLPGTYPSVSTKGGTITGAIGNVLGSAVSAYTGRGRAVAINPYTGLPMRRRRSRGITSRELRGFKKVTKLLHSVGMQPRGLGHRVVRKR